MQKPNLQGCFGNPGIFLNCAPGQKCLKGLPRATHSTYRGQNSGNVTPTVDLCPPHPPFRTKVRARRDVPKKKKMTTIIRSIHLLQVPTTQLANMSIDPKFVELTADVLSVFTINMHYYYILYI